VVGSLKVAAERVLNGAGSSDEGPGDANSRCTLEYRSGRPRHPRRNHRNVARDGKLAAALSYGDGRTLEFSAKN